MYQAICSHYDAAMCAPFTNSKFMRLQVDNMAKPDRLRHSPVFAHVWANPHC